MTTSPIMGTGRFVPREERASVPFTCATCRAAGSQVGVLVFDGDEVPECENHKRALKEGSMSPSDTVMVPVSSLPASVLQALPSQ